MLSIPGQAYKGVGVHMHRNLDSPLHWSSDPLLVAMARSTAPFGSAPCED